MNNLQKLIVMFVVIFAMAIVLPSVLAQDMDGQHQTVHWFADASEVDGAEAVLHRLDTGVNMRLDTTGLTEGDAVTVWWVIFNEPGNCSDGVCGEDDIFALDDEGAFIMPDDGSNPMNFDQIGEAQISAVRADGHVIDLGGTALFQGHLPAGDASEAAFGPGLLNPLTAEIHLVVRTHSTAIPGQIDAMINSLNGGCADEFPNEPCTDVQFAVFAPPEM